VPALPVIGTFQAILSWETLDELIVDATSRVPARLPFGSVQLAAAAAGAAAVLVADVVVACVCALVADELVAADDDADVDDDDFLELPPQPASSPTAAMSATSTPQTCPRVFRPGTLIKCT
jgi:hypothetical protein